MTTPRIEKVGLVAEYSPPGDWTFDAALTVARSHHAVFNIFRFLESPYEIRLDVAPQEVPRKAHDEWTLIVKDRELREYYDERLGDFVEAGFRICESGRHFHELSLCLMHREFQVLYIPYLSYGVAFGNAPIEVFAYRFIAPVVLVGPTRPDQYFLNPPAEIIAESQDLGLTEWQPVQERTQ
jgi:hypothetical protein